MTTQELLQRTRSVKDSLLSLNTEEKNRILCDMASSLIRHIPEILDGNRIDVEKSRGIISDVMIDRLSLSEERIYAMADGIINVSKLSDPVGKILSEHTHENGMIIKKVSIPMGVVAIIYESRPNVTSDAAALCFKSGNACILRGGKEAYNSALAIVNALKVALKNNNLPEDLISLVSDTSRESAREIMTAKGFVDLLIPRGGKGLISACVENATVPCIETGTGICHIYVDKDADLEMAVNIVENAKVSRPSVCNACESLLVHKDIAKEFLPMLKDRLSSSVELRTCPVSYEIIGGTPAKEVDYQTEFLDYILAVKVENSIDDAILHIKNHSTLHSESIITSNTETAEHFMTCVDSGNVYWNASTRFTDGGEFGLGCEMGISTQKLHARGPMGLEELTCYKYKIYGNGQTR